MLKTLLEPTPRSRSSDNLEKFSPLIGRRSQGDSPLTASPLARRNTTDNAQTHERIVAKSGSNKDTSSNSIVSTSADTSKRSTLPITGSGTNLRSLRDSDENVKMLQLTTAANSLDRDVSLATSVPKDYESRKSLTKKSTMEVDKSASQPLPSLKLRSTGFDLRSPTNNNSSTKNNSEASKSPVLKPLTKGNSSTNDGKSNGVLSKTKLTPPATAPKPRPWSMATDRKSGKFRRFKNSNFTIY